MKYKGIIILSLIFLLSIAAIFFLFDTSEDEIPFSFRLESADKSERITCFTEEDDKDILVFLPSYADLHNLKFELNTDTDVFVDDKRISDGMSCEDFEFDKAYNVAYKSWGSSCNVNITFIHSSNVPAMYIDTMSGNMDLIHRKKGNEEQGTMRIYTSDGSVDFSGELESVNGRGNSTWDSFSKKPYSINLKNEADILSMGTANKWILIANADEFSHIRNKAIFDFSKNLGLEYSPDSRWVDLYLNGEYAGLYLLCERNEIHENRVNISDTDGFLVSMELEERLVSQEIPYVTTKSGIDLRVHNPLTPSAENLQIIKKTMQAFENAVLSPDGVDSVSGKHWRELIDVDSFAKKYLIEEVFGNVDACALSQYFYCDTSSPDAKIYAGPVWDYDHTMGIDSIWQIRSPYVMVANRPAVTASFDTPWFYALYQNEEFFARVLEIYESDFKPLLQKLMTEDMKEYNVFISEASAMNKLRWNDVLLSSEEEINNISDYMNTRVNFLESVWFDKTEYLTVRADSSFGVHFAYYYVIPGESLDVLPEFESTDKTIFAGWYYADTNEPFQKDNPVNENLEIYAKWINAESKFENVKELSPLFIFGIIFLCIVITDIKRNRKGDHK